GDLLDVAVVIPPQAQVRRGGAEAGPARKSAGLEDEGGEGAGALGVGGDGLREVQGILGRERPPGAHVEDRGRGVEAVLDHVSSPDEPAAYSRLLSSNSWSANSTLYGCSSSRSGSHSLRGTLKKSPP